VPSYLHCMAMALAIGPLAVPAPRAEERFVGGSAAAGRTVFSTYCIRCHGEQADGNSELARVLRPAPANLRRSALTAEQKVRVVHLGGPAGLGRASVMPSWDGILSDGQILDVVAYVETLRESAD